MSVAVGIDVAEARKGLDLVAIDGARRVSLRLNRAAVGDVADAVSGLKPDVVCIDSPPASALSGRSRAAERELRRLGITAFSTPTDPGSHPFYRWMQVVFAVFAAIADDYPRFCAGDVRGTAVEVFPEASAVILEGRLRSKAEPKAQFRRRVLEHHGVDCTGLASIDAVGAALAALTGVLALEGTFSTVGDPDEGVILLPVAAFPSSRLERPAGDATTVSTAKSSATASDVAAEGRFCRCGCGATVRRHFPAGHDAGLKSRLLRLQAEGRAATQQLRELGWGDNGEI